MKKISLIAAAVLCLMSATAQEKNNLGLGLSLNQFQHDFGIGIHLISPYFANNSVAVRLGANVQWLQHVDKNHTTWTSYQNIQLGIRGRQPILDNRLFIYGEGGPVLLLPNADFSSEPAVFGGYGLLGFEFKASSSFGFFMELGAMGTGATADKVPAKPIYSNGFTSSTGFRVFF